MTARTFTLALGAMLFLIAGAQAQTSGFYAAGDIGYHWPDTVRSHVAGTDEQWAWGVRDDADGFLRLGYGFGSGFRVEVEGGYRPGNLNAIQADIFLPAVTNLPLIPAGGIHLSDVSGHVNATTLMLNGYYDIPLGLPVQPFVGGGIGVVHAGVVAQGGFPFCAICFRPAICFPVCSVNLKVNDSSDVFGWQAIGGLSWQLAPQWTVDATYRYLRANNLGWSTEGGGVLFTPGRFRGDYADNSVTIGIRYAFNGPP